MNTNIKGFICITLALAVFFSAFTAPVWGSGGQVMDEYGFAQRSDTKIEYGVYGASNKNTVVLLSGNGDDMHAFDHHLLPVLAQNYKVITLSARGTGNTDVGKTHLSFELQSDDVLAVLDKLKIDKCNIVGYSDGANLGIVFTLRYPQKVSKLCIISGNINTFGVKPSFQLPVIGNFILYSFKSLFDPSKENITNRELFRMMAYQPNLTSRDLKKIAVPVLQFYADDDIIYNCHSEMIARNIPDCKSVMIRNSTHGTVFLHTYDIIAPALLDFLN